MACRGQYRSAIVLSPILSGGSEMSAQTRSQLLENIRLVDLESASVGDQAWIRIDAGKIVQIGTGEPAAGDAAVEDLDGAFVIPGLWDVHAHPSGYLPRPSTETAAQR